MIDAMIGPRRKKLMNRVVVGSVDLDAIETGFSSQRSSLPKACNQLFNLIGHHRPWRLRSGTQRGNRRRRTQTLIACQLGLCDAAAVIDLEDRETSCRMHRFGEPVETGQMSIILRAYSLPGAPVLFDVSGGGNGNSESAAARRRTNSSSSSAAVPSSWEESVVSGAIANRFAISRPQLNLKGDQTTIDQTSDIPKPDSIIGAFRDFAFASRSRRSGQARRLNERSARRR